MRLVRKVLGVNSGQNINNNPKALGEQPESNNKWKGAESSENGRDHGVTSPLSQLFA